MKSAKILALCICVFISIVPQSTGTDIIQWIYDNEGSIKESPKGFNRKNRDTQVSDCELGLCEEINDYPEELISKLLDETPLYKMLFKSAKIPNFDNRHADPFDGQDQETMCGTMRYTKYPQKMLNKRNQTKIVINQPGFYQPVHVDVCRKNSDGKKGCIFSDGFPLGIWTECKQKDTILRLIAMESDKSVAVDEFGVPCGCVCVIHRN